MRSNNFNKISLRKKIIKNKGGANLVFLSNNINIKRQSFEKKEKVWYRGFKIASPEIIKEYNEKYNLLKKLNKFIKNSDGKLNRELNGIFFYNKLANILYINIYKEYIFYLKDGKLLIEDPENFITNYNIALNFNNIMLEKVDSINILDSATITKLENKTITFLLDNLKIVKYSSDFKTDAQILDNIALLLSDAKLSVITGKKKRPSKKKQSKRKKESKKNRNRVYKK